MRVCNQCGGDGRTFFQDEWDTCYHCAGSGVITDQQEYADRVTAMAGLIAHDLVAKQKAAVDQGDEGWIFLAAENRLTGNELFVIEVDRTTRRIQDEFAKLSADLMDVLLLTFEAGWLTNLKRDHCDDIRILDQRQNLA
jgi:DnaJ-class molecular chaperone